MRATQLLLLSTTLCFSLGITSAFAMMGNDEFISTKKGTPVRIKGRSRDEGPMPILLVKDWGHLGLVKTNPMDVKGGQTLTVSCDFDEVTAPTAISFLNSAQNAYYEGGVTIFPGQKSITFSSVVPDGDTQTWLIIRNPGFDGKTLLSFGLRLNAMDIDVENAPKSQILKPVDFLQDWAHLGLIKTNPIDVKGGQDLTVTCNFEDVTVPTAISFLNSAQNGYYAGGVTVLPGQKSVTFSSVVPERDTQTWLIIRHPGFDGKTALPFGLRLNEILLKVGLDPHARIAKILNPLADQSKKELATIIKALNPTMEDAIASAWGNSLSPKFLKGTMGTGYSNEQLTYTFQPPEGLPLTLYRHIMPGYLNGCGYYSLGITPREARRQLRHHLKPESLNAVRYKNIIAEEIFEAVKYHNLPGSLRNNLEIARLYEEMATADLLVNELTRPLNQHLGRGSVDLPAYPVGELTLDLFPNLDAVVGGLGTVSDVFVLLQDATNALEVSMQAIREWGKKDEIIRAYIKAEIRPGVQLTFLPNAQGEQKSGIIDILADINGLNLNIYEPVRDAPQQLRLTHTHITLGAVRQRNILYNPGHYDRLENALHRHVIPN
ncbi:MAG: hypothetical protein HYX35_03780 [Proteobacteria bacterium]|nr:hypothetical protein [Pseudomonadota bacterium]